MNRRSSKLSWRHLLAEYCVLESTRQHLLACHTEAAAQAAEFSAWAEGAMRGVMEDIGRQLAIRVAELRRVTGCDVQLSSRILVNAPRFAVAAFRLALFPCQVEVYALRQDEKMPRIHLAATVIRSRGHGRMLSYPGYALVPGTRAGYELRDLRTSGKVERVSAEHVTLRALDLLLRYCSARTTAAAPHSVGNFGPPGRRWLEVSQV